MRKRNGKKKKKKKKRKGKRKLQEAVQQVHGGFPVASSRIQRWLRHQLHFPFQENGEGTPSLQGRRQSGEGPVVSWRGPTQEEPHHPALGRKRKLPTKTKLNLSSIFLETLPQSLLNPTPPEPLKPRDSLLLFPLPTIPSQISLSPFVLSFDLFICLVLFLFALGLWCCAWAFSSCDKLNLLSSSGAWASHCDFSRCKAQSLGHLGFSSWGTWAQ